MKERPILFSAPMVRAILGGRKTQTRRIVKGEPLAWLADSGFAPDFVADKDNSLCPFGIPGDRLWVRETWKVMLHSPGYDNGLQESGGEDSEPGVATIAYRAGGDMVTVDFLEDREDEQAGRGMPQWKPSIHMPRWASRITLEIVNIRVERLRDISEEDAIAEGVNLGGSSMGHKFTAKEHFEGLWQSIYTKDGQPWNDNPWVWVVEFKRIAA